MSTRPPAWRHQIEGTQKILGSERGFALFDDVGLGKSRQVVDAVCEAHARGQVDAIVIVSPAFARSVWASPDPLLGEFAKHAWEGLDYGLYEYCARLPKLPDANATAPRSRLHVVVTNYEFIRREERLKPLCAWAEKRRTWLVLDESWAVKTHNTQQTKACKALRSACTKAILLNGTPGAPAELYSQFDIIDPKILNCANFYAFRARYCKMGGWQNKQIVGYHEDRMAEFKRRTAPHAMRRLAKDCLDLPPVLPPLTIEARLTEKTWALYKAMRDDLVAWLSQSEVSVAAQAGVRTLRLAQLLAGFLGGVEVDEDLLHEKNDPIVLASHASTTREVGKEKLDTILEFLSAQELNKAVVWCQFRPEMARMAAALRERGLLVHMLQGQQKPEEREAAKRAFAPGTSCQEQAVLVGHPAAGGAGINLAAANLAIYASHTGSLIYRQQSEGRLNRPGQTQPVRFVDVIATGPDGQKTYDHAIVAALRAKEDIATWTANSWLRALAE